MQILSPGQKDEKLPLMSFLAAAGDSELRK